MDEPLKILATDINKPRESAREVTCISPDQTKTEKKHHLWLVCVQCTVHTCVNADRGMEKNASFKLNTV